MQNQNHTALDDKFTMNFGGFDPDNLFSTHMGSMGVGMKRSAHEAGLDREAMGLSSDDDTDFMKKEGGLNASSSGRENMIHQQTSLDQPQQKQNLLPNGKKTKGRVKIKMEFIDNKLRRYTTFSKRKTGIMKKAYELSTLTGTQVMLLVASETGHVYTFATRKLQPMITSEAGKALIQTCLNSPDPPSSHQYHHHDQRMSATGYEETELTYAVPDDDNSKCCEAAPPDQAEYSLAPSSSASECSSPPASPPPSPPPARDSSLSHGTDDGSNVFAPVCSSSSSSCAAVSSCSTSLQLPSGLLITPTPPISGGVVVGSAGSSVVYAAGGGLLYSAAAPGREGVTGATATPLFLPIQLTQNMASVPHTGVGVKQSQEPSSSQSKIVNSSSDLPAIINNSSSLMKKLASNDLSISTSVASSSLQLTNDSFSKINNVSNIVTASSFNDNSVSGGVIRSRGCRTIASEATYSLKTLNNNLCLNSTSPVTLLTGPGSKNNCPKLSQGSLMSPETSCGSAEVVNKPSAALARRPNTTNAFRQAVSPCAKLLFSDEEDLENDESGPDRNDDERDSVQQAFPTDLSMNVRRKK